MLLAGLVHFQSRQVVVEANQRNLEALALLNRVRNRRVSNPEIPVLDARKVPESLQFFYEHGLVLGRDVLSELEEHCGSLAISGVTL